MVGRRTATTCSLALPRAGRDAAEARYSSAALTTAASQKAPRRELPPTSSSRSSSLDHPRSPRASRSEPSFSLLRRDSSDADRSHRSTGRRPIQPPRPRSACASRPPGSSASVGARAHEKRLLSNSVTDDERRQSRGSVIDLPSAIERGSATAACSQASAAGRRQARTPLDNKVERARERERVAAEGEVRPRERRAAARKRNQPGNRRESGGERACEVGEEAAAGCDDEREDESSERCGQLTGAQLWSGRLRIAPLPLATTTQLARSTAARSRHPAPAPKHRQPRRTPRRPRPPLPPRSTPHAAASCVRPRFRSLSRRTCRARRC